MRKNKTKMIHAAAVLTAAALLSGGIYLLVRDDISQWIEWNKLKDYAPSPTVCETLNNADNANAEISQDTANEMTAQVRRFGESCDNAIGWIYIPDTNINYPVMQSGDNAFYLHRSTNGSYLYVGSIFLDYHCNADFSGVSSILYGHNMGDGSMFADVINFTDKAYFDSHRYGWLTTENDVFSVYFFSVDQVENTSGIYNADSDWRMVMSEVVNHAVVYDDIEIADTDKLLMLSTCTGANGDSRTVLVGKMMEGENS